MKAMSLEKVAVAGSKARDRIRAGMLFSSGAAIFLLLTAAAESLYPNFNLQTNAISDLAATTANTAILEEIAILVFGLCWTLGAFLLFHNSSRKWMVLNILPGVGYLLAGISPENVNVSIHSAGALLAFPLGAFAAIASYRITTSKWKYVSLAMGSLSLVPTFLIFFGYRVICGTCGYQQGLKALLLGLGGLETMIIYPILIWLIGFGSYLMTAKPDVLEG